MKHRSRFSVILGTCAAGMLAILTANAETAPAGWKLTWSDEFNQPGLPDPKAWTYEVGFVRNSESQYYTERRAENARVEDGNLVIEARKERFTNPRYNPDAAAKAAAKAATQPATGADGKKPLKKINNAITPEAEYTAASVTTKGKLSWKYGRIEVRAKLPRGIGIWPAIWMLGVNHDKVGWPACGEIDIMEFVGFEPQNIHANVHNPERVHGKLPEKELTARGLKGVLKLANTDQEFHVYALEWDAEQMRFFVDDRSYLTYKNPHTGEKAWPFDQPFYLLLNIAVGGGWGGQKGIDDSIFPQRMYVDYVRVYEKA